MPQLTKRIKQHMTATGGKGHLVSLFLRQPSSPKTTFLSKIHPRADLSENNHAQEMFLQNQVLF